MVAAGQVSKVVQPLMTELCGGLLTAGHTQSEAAPPIRQSLAALLDS